MGIPRELTAADWLRILRRRRWRLILPAVLGAVLGVAVATVLPKQYTSHTTVLVEEPVVPDSYVKPVVSDDLNQRLAGMQGQILSRTRLQDLIQQLHLYPSDAGRIPVEVLVERLRKSIKVSPVSIMPGAPSQSLPGFNVDVTYGDAWLAQQICSRITTMFMDSNSRLRQEQSEDTTQFLAQQLTEAKAKLDEQDARLAAFQRQHLGEQPEDANTNLTLLTGLSQQLEAVTQGLNQAQQQKAFTQSLLSQQLAASAAQKTPDGRSAQTLQQQLDELQRQLATLEARYTENHPSVLRVKDAIARLQKKIREAPAQEEALGSRPDPRASAVESPQVQQLRAQIEQENLATRQKEQEQARLQHEMSVLQGRIQLSPAVEQEYKSITRDYQTALDFYNDLLKKQNNSQMATELERRQQGESFRVLDPPSLPQRPSFPDRRLFALGGLGLGLVLGAGLVQLAESQDKSLRNSRDVELYLKLPAVAVISSFRAPAEHEARGRRLAG
ncbi:MAG TPA: Wzz/FepE/Etk N-terminal domain-containing protein [Terriglobales bacterium]|jgi:polysaccharide chain length determinant protein (PEP-CTERM system associated)|nr:Wzz/FepE/Etk N-terminal domain-containing protein [Terriglobales bacterium]